MGNNCTRNCRYCNITCERPEPLDIEEPKRVAQAVKDLGLKYSVITSVTRDDLQDGGAKHFADCIYEIKKISPDTKIEILTPDFKGDTKALDTIIQAKPDVFNHNIETVKELFKIELKFMFYFFKKMQKVTFPIKIIQNSTKIYYTINLR